MRLKIAFDYNSLNKYFTFACFSAPPIVGSVSSFILHGGALWGLFKVCSGAIGLSRDRGMISLAIPLYVYSAAYVLSFAANPVTTESWRYLLPIPTLLLFPFLYSSWCISRKETIAAYAIEASAVACYGALCVAAVQFHGFGMRAEGGAGNAIVFATVTCLAASVALAGIFVRNRIPVGLLLGAFLAGTAAILYSGSRMTWVALILVAVIIIIVHRRDIPIRVSRRSLAFAALSAAVIAIVGYETVLPRIADFAGDVDQLIKHGNHDTSLGLRAGLWEIGLELVRDSPLVGHGPQSTGGLIEQGFREKMNLHVNYTHFHNGILNASVQSGILGALSLVAIFFVTIWNAVRTLAATDDTIEVFGAIVLVVAFSTYMFGGLTGILIGHDVLDSTLMAFLAVGTFLSSGTSPLDGAAGEAQPRD